MELPRYIFESLSGLEPDAMARALTPLVEQIVDTLRADRGYLLHMPKDAPLPDVLADWTRAGLPDRPPVDLAACPWIFRRIVAGDFVMLAHIPEDLPSDAADDANCLVAEGVRSQLVVPVAAPDRLVAIVVESLTREQSWDEHVPELRFVAEMFATALRSAETQQELMRARADLARVNQRLESETRAFRDDILTVHDFDDIVGSSPVFVAALAALREVAPTDTTALLLGETGTGKELFARALHERSERRRRPFVCVNCAALPASLIESELFGHERGAFTGAINARLGRFELADHGTIFLDEIGDLPLELQPKLLRVLQEHEFERVGSSTRRKVDVRVIAATHNDLEAAVIAGRFRADLYYRLSVFPITLPPLRERREDIPHLVWFLINQRQRRLHRRITEIPKPTMDALCDYHWPGNVRELENVIERAMIRSPEGTLHIDESLRPAHHDSVMPPVIAMPVSEGGTLETLERTHIEATLRACRGRINGPGNAAERLGLHPNTLRFRMKKLGISRSVALTT